MRPSRLPPELSEAIATGEGLVRRSELNRLGLPRSKVDRLLRRELIVPLANGIYADPTVVAAASPWELHRLRTRAFIMVSPPNTYAADWSAVALHQLATMGDPPAVPSVIRPRPGRSGSNLTVNGRTRFTAVPDRWLGEIDGTGVVGAAFAAVDIGRRADRLTSLVLADAVAAREHGRELLAGAVADIDGWPGDHHAAWAVRHCDADVESPLESIGRLAFIIAGLPPSRSNEWVGEYVPELRLDHYWPEHRVGAEADGLNKYADNPALAIRNEKEREWRIQRMGIRIIRYGWKVAAGSPDVLAAQVRELLNAPPLPPKRLRTWPHQEGRAMLGMGPSSYATGPTWTR